MYSRRGYGQSDPVELPRPLDYMTREALDVLPDILDAIGFKNGLLLGHSDGASIASIYAGSVQDHRISGLVLIAPHFFTEELQLQEIAAAKVAYEQGTLKQRLAKYHASADSAFYGWNDAWLHADFKSWNISELINDWTVPALLVQGRNDQFGSAAQLEEVQQRAACPVEVELIDDCQHAPHLQKPEITIDVVRHFVSKANTSHLYN